MLIAAWSNFFGANLRADKKRLPEGFGVNCVNLRPGAANLGGWREASTVVTTGGVTPLISAYRMNRAVVSDTSAWLQWTVDVDVVRSLIANDTTEEIYYTGDGAPKRTDNVLGLPATPQPAASRPLGIPKPTTAMNATLDVAGSGADETRVYVDTFKNNQGREGAPGLPRSIVVPGGSTVDLDTFDPVPGGHPDVTLRCIYVSVDGSEYALVAEIAVATTAHTDTGSRGRILESGGSELKPAWEMPPSNLKGLISLWNGMIGGFFGKSYAICEPYKPWAWPVKYQAALPDDIVGTGKWLQNWLILTTAQPFLLTGASPLGMGEQPIEFDQSCTSKRSIAGVNGGVAWGSPNGLCFIGEGVRPNVVTADMLTPEQWSAMAPSTLIGTRYEDQYIGFYDDGNGLKGFMIDPRNPRGIIFLTQGARGVFYDPISGCISRTSATSSGAGTTPRRHNCR